MFNDEAKNSCAFSAVIYMLLTFLNSSLAVFADVVPYARICYQQHCANTKKDRFSSYFAATEVANYFGLSENVDFDEIGGFIYRDYTDVESFPSLSNALKCLSNRKRFSAVLTLGASTRAIEKNGNVFRLFDSHGSLGNIFVPSQFQTQDFAVSVEFQSLNDLFNCLFGFHSFANDAQYSLLYLREKPKTSLQNFVSQVQQQQPKMPSPTATTTTTRTTTTSPTSKSYAAVAAKNTGINRVTVPRVIVLPYVIFVFCFLFLIEEKKTLDFPYIFVCACMRSFVLAGEQQLMQNKRQRRQRRWRRRRWRSDHCRTMTTTTTMTTTRPRTN